MSAKEVHAISSASQPEIQFACDGTYSEPKWGTSPDLAGYLTSAPWVYQAENGRLYSFESELVTCEACLAPKKVPA